MSSRVCRYCHCTEDRACPGGCAWVAPDVCSAKACVERAYLDCYLTSDLGESIENPIEDFSDGAWNGL